MPALDCHTRTWHGYVEGYKLAADLFVQHIGDTYSKQNYLIYPIVFVYRQAIEVGPEAAYFSKAFSYLIGSRLFQSNTDWSLSG